MFEIVVLFILIAPIIVRHIDLYFYSNEDNEEDDFLVIVHDAFSDLLNVKRIK